ncbi:alpha/beta fold hydrolase [Lysobacter fragariae]
MKTRFLRGCAGVALAVAIIATAVAVDPYALVRIEYARQRVAANLSRETIYVAGHRWVYAHNDDAPAGAPTVVMLHGFTGSKENWYPVAARLRGRYRLLIPDLPGWGESERKPATDYGFNAQAGYVDAFIRALSPGRPVVLLGHSMGGGIVPIVAARYPQDVKAVGLLAAAGVRFRDNQFGRDVLAGHNPFAVTDAGSLDHYLDILFFDRAARPFIPWPASTGLIRRRRADGDFEQSVLDHIGRGDERFAPGEAADAVRQPALLLWCRRDAVIDASAMALYAARMPQARQVMLDGCGHLSLMERPGEVAAAVETLVDTIPNEGPR